MPAVRHFLGWNEPLVETGSAWLIGAASDGGTCDLTDYLVVVASERGRRRLLERLVARAEAGALALIPPQIVTPGSLFSLLAPPQRPVADDLTALVARVAALRTAPLDQIQALVRCPPDAEDWTGWFALARELQGVHAEFSAGELTPADVAARCRTLSGDYCDAATWEAVDRLHDVYRAALDTIGRQDALEERQRVLAPGAPSTAWRVVLLGAPDLNAQVARFLRSETLRVIALVAAPETESAGFDSLGLLHPEYWASRPLRVEPEQWLVVDRPRDQAAAVVETLAGWAEEVSAAEVVVGLGDAALAPWVERALTSAGVRSRAAAGRSADHSAPAQLLAALADYLQQPDRPRWAALVRHPDLEVWLVRSLSAQGHPGAEDLLAGLDRYVEGCLPDRLGADWLERKETGLLRAACELLEGLLQSFRREPRPLPLWSEPVAAVLREIYGAQVLDPQRREEAALTEALVAVAGALRAQALLPPALSPQLDGAAALAFTVQRLAEVVLPHPPDAAAVELVGWLELPNDDARTVVVTGFNEGLIPEAVNGDALLPNSLRRVLGLVDNERRYARDALTLWGLLAGRTRLRIISGRQGSEGAPLAPSRLLLADDAVLAKRVREFYAPAEDAASLPRLLLPAGKALRLEVPLPESAPCLERLAVTGFRDYLACPYRFYLRHVLRLDSPDDTQPELDGGLFGNLAHETLARGGLAGGLAGDNPTAIEGALCDTLVSVTRSLLGNNLSPVVQLQLRHLGRRLARFAGWQAEQAREGWETVYWEQRVETRLQVDGQPFTVKARIDRIDRHPSEGWRVIDYKTGDGMSTPEAAHRATRDGKKVWIDLQLPLYRRLAAALQLPTEGLELAYVLLPQAATPKPLQVARWSAAELDEAEGVAEQVIRDLRASRFWPPAGEPPTYPDGLGAICQDRCPPNRRRLAKPPEQLLPPPTTISVSETC
ncbi:MAG: PD-(D/E)XK nuclease family protein [Actinomycetota bacterium]